MASVRPSLGPLTKAPASSHPCGNSSAPNSQTRAELALQALFIDCFGFGFDSDFALVTPWNLRLSGWRGLDITTLTAVLTVLVSSSVQRALALESAHSYLASSLPLLSRC